MENNNPPIRFFEMLGLSEEELSEYAIRLNQSSGAWFDAMTMYYEHHDELMDWVFTRRWNGSKAGGNIRQPKVLQFIQLDGREKPAIHWLFIGGYEVGETVMQGNDEVYQRKPIERFLPFEARTVVVYRKRRGATQMVNGMADAGLRSRFFDTMLVEKIAQSPVSAMPFPGYDNVRLSFSELVAAVHNDEWRGALGAVNAVYLQTDTRTGWHYVGSAYSRHGGAQGLLSRWEEYANGDHTGGNALLRALSQNTAWNTSSSISSTPSSTSLTHACPTAQSSNVSTGGWMPSALYVTTERHHRMGTIPNSNGIVPAKEGKPD